MMNRIRYFILFFAVWTVDGYAQEITEVYFPKKQISLLDNGKPDAIIVLSERQEQYQWASRLQEFFLNKWGVRFEITEWEVAKRSKKHLILYGPGNSNTPLRQLDANLLLGNNPYGYELRTIPNALDWGRDVLYLGGKDSPTVLKAAAALSTHAESIGRIPFTIDCEGWKKDVSAGQLDSMVLAIEQHYAGDVSTKTRVAMTRFLREPATLYRMTGNDVYAETFSRMVRVITDNYKGPSGYTEIIPSFTFHLFPRYLYTIEHSPAFTEDDRKRSLRFIKQVVQEMMEHWEMEAPIRLYKSGKQDYLTNHACFASRSVGNAAMYMLSRYNYEPAIHWKAIADNAFDGVAPHPFSPEDAAGYQYLVYQIFMDYAMMSGRYNLDFFNSKVFVDYIRFVKLKFSHSGSIAGYGDTQPLANKGSRMLLQYAVDILGDQEAAYIIHLMDGKRSKAGKHLSPPGAHTNGLTYQSLVPFKQDRYNLEGLYNRPLLDKATFRSGWKPDDDFMFITGINGDGLNHSHFDANGVSQYLYGDRLWLFEGDYIRKYPNDHNSLVVSRNGTLPDQTRPAPRRYKAAVSQIRAAINTRDRSMSLLSILLEDYNGLDWTRNINYVGKQGFWVVDELDIKQEDRYTTEIYWRGIGSVRSHGQSVELVQKKSPDERIPHHFFITEGTGAGRLIRTALEGGHGGKDGYLADYRFADKQTQYVIQRHQGHLKNGDKILFVNFLQAVPGATPAPPVISRLSATTFIAESNGILRLASLGNTTAGNLDIQAEAVFAGPEGIVARGATHIRIGDVQWQSSAPADTALELSESLKSGLLKKILQDLMQAGTTKDAGVPEKLSAKQKKTVGTIRLEAAVSAIAGEGPLTAIGCQDGQFLVTDDTGEKMLTRRFSTAISAITGITTKSGIHWAIGLVPEEGRDTATVCLLNPDGSTSWTKPINGFHNRNGTITTLFTARLDKKNRPSSIVLGSEAWHYTALSLRGELIWKNQVFHGATVGAAADMNGDGLDEIAAGIEYYYHTLVSADGQSYPRNTTSPWDYAVATADLDGNGMAEAIFGRGDGHIYVMAPPGNPYRTWNLNVGGKPNAIVDLKTKEPMIAVANDLGQISFVNGHGSRVSLVELPASVSDMKLWKNKLYAVSADGYVYVVSTSGTLMGKYACSFSPASVYRPKMAVADQHLAVFSGNEVYFIDAY